MVKHVQRQSRNESVGAAVKFDGVQKSYDGESLVVKDLNLDIAAGEFLTMLGPSGSGKTTCLMMLAGFEPPTHGAIYLDDREISQLPPHKRGIGMVFQNYALFPHMTVYENLAYPLKVRGKSRAEIRERVERALAMVELPGFGTRKPGQLSGGQQQRIAVARSLVFEPNLVLMDEPLGALDKQLREQMQFEIKHLHENLGVTVVYVTHDQTEALTMSDRVAVFNDGVIQQLSSPSDLYEHPKNSFVAQFIGENNKLSGRVERLENGTCEVVLDTGSLVLAEAVNVDGVGARTTLSLRPERVMIDPPQADTLLGGRIEELIYMGETIRARLAVEGNDSFIVKVPNRGDGTRLTEGAQVQVGWRTSDCHALDPVAV